MIGTFIKDCFKVPEDPTAELRAEVETAMASVRTEVGDVPSHEQLHGVPKVFWVYAECKNCGTEAQSYAIPGYESHAWAGLVQLIRRHRVGEKDCSCRERLAAMRATA